MQWLPPFLPPRFQRGGNARPASRARRQDRRRAVDLACYQPQARFLRRPVRQPDRDLRSAGLIVGSATEANRAAVRSAFAAWQAGTGAITSLFAPDMVWRIEGRSAASKEYRNRQQFIDEVLAPFGARFAAGERFRPVRVRSVHTDGDTVIVVWDGSG